MLVKAENHSWITVRTVFLVILFLLQGLCLCHSLCSLADSREQELVADSISLQQEHAHGHGAVCRISGKSIPSPLEEKSGFEVSCFGEISVEDSLEIDESKLQKTNRIIVLDPFIKRKIFLLVQSFLC